MEQAVVAVIPSHARSSASFGLVVPGLAVVVTFVVVAVVVGAPWVALGVTGAAAVLWPAVTEDLATGRIPNRLTGIAGVVVLAAGASAAATGEVDITSVAAGVVWGVVLSGALGLAIIWFAAPRLIGGGDVKMLAVVGAATGLADARAAFVAGMTAVGIQIVASVTTRRRQLPFAPALYAGFVTGAISMIWLHVNVGAV